ncbi:MAG: pentapeptide repeat-containing protein [Nostocaceae cyanobacterium]|nr:pentapeptide repeat-containing protein [Nostocaceae cyanobacterium]
MGSFFRQSQVPQNLCSCSFKGQNLAGACFRCADIRSADFTGGSS